MLLSPRQEEVQITYSSRPGACPNVCVAGAFKNPKWQVHGLFFSLKIINSTKYFMIEDSDKPNLDHVVINPTGGNDTQYIVRRTGSPAKCIHRRAALSKQVQSPIRASNRVGAIWQTVWHWL